MSTFFTSDLHLGHARICELAYRPFRDVEAMNEALIDGWNAIVGPNDTVFVLGDVVMGKLADTLSLVSLLDGHKTLLPGNHDRCWHGNRKVGSWEQRFLDAGFESVLTDAYEIQTIELFDGRVVKMCHFPYTGDHTQTVRYATHRPEDDGHSWLLHGHTHGSWRQRGRMIDVGVDAWGGKPISMDTIVETINAGPQNLEKLEWV